MYGIIGLCDIIIYERGIMIKQSIDGIKFKLKEYQDFSWLNNYGTVFSFINETGSGCISFGVKK